MIRSFKNIITHRFQSSENRGKIVCNLQSLIYLLDKQTRKYEETQLRICSYAYPETNEVLNLEESLDRQEWYQSNKRILGIKKIILEITLGKLYREIQVNYS